MKIERLAKKKFYKINSKELTVHYNLEIIAHI